MDFSMKGFPIFNFSQLDVDNCDDIEVVFDDIQDLIKFDKLMNMFRRGLLWM